MSHIAENMASNFKFGRLSSTIAIGICIRRDEWWLWSTDYLCDLESIMYKPHNT
jgi:hypothetical protein